MPKPDRFDFIVRDAHGEYASRTGNAADPRLREYYEREVANSAEDGYEVLGIRINGFSTLYTIDEIEAQRT